MPQYLKEVECELINKCQEGTDYWKIWIEAKFQP